MRIVGGEWRGRGIDAPPDPGRASRARGASRGVGAGAAGRRGPPSSLVSSPLRPTTDRARETLFNVLAHDPGANVRGATVLDAFAGTGALGLEALSRGAAHATFVERDASARRLIAATLRRLGGEDRAAILPRDALRPGPAPRAHDLVLLDPPYGRGLAERALLALAREGWLAHGARVVIEEAAGADVAWPEGFEASREVGVGGTRFHLGRFGGRGPVRRTGMTASGGADGGGTDGGGTDGRGGGPHRP